MPRVHRRGHKARGAELSREDVIAELLKPGSFALCQSPDDIPVLSPFSPEERQAIYDEACRRDWERREREREPILKSRLAEWDVSTWGAIFCERPDLLEALTPEQRERWDAWKAGKQTSSAPPKVLQMRRKPEAR